MPYRDKDKLKEYQKNYFKKNQGLLNLKQKRRRSETPLTQSQATNDSIPDSLPTQSLNSLPNLSDIRAKIKDIELGMKPKRHAEVFKDDVVIERVYE